jgi:hypothetical protein
LSFHCFESDTVLRAILLMATTHSDNCRLITICCTRVLSKNHYHKMFLFCSFRMRVSWTTIKRWVD